MKKIIIIFHFAFTYFSINAQLPPPGGYLTNTTMAAFHGTWQWVNGTDTVKLFLDTKKVWFNYGDGFFWDCLVGWHMYKRGNTIIESSFANIVNGIAYTFLGGNENQATVKNITGTIKDLTKHKEVHLDLTLNSANNQLTWKLTELQGMRIRVAGMPPLQDGFTLPENMVLIKQ